MSNFGKGVCGTEKLREEGVRGIQKCCGAARGAEKFEEHCFRGSICIFMLMKETKPYIFVLPEAFE